MSSDGERVEALLTEVTNTPWGERQDYVIAAADSPVIRASFQKTMHVSPFMPMDQCYLARATPRGDTVSVHIENRDAGGPAFDATLSLKRRELTPASARWLTLRYPLATVRVVALIYGHAVGLKLASARMHPHPRTQSA